jgi:hypothetical protein
MDGGGFAYDYFISRRGTAAALAREAADVLAAAGYMVRVQDYDFAASGQFVRDIDDALKQCRHLLILHTADYHDSFWTRSEFHNFLAAVVLGAEHPDTLISVNNLAHGLQALGEASAALPLYRRAAKGLERKLGSNHPNTKIVKANYKRALKVAGKPWWGFRRIAERLISRRT